MPRKKNIENQVEKGIEKLLEKVMAADFTSAQSEVVELKLKVLNSATNYIKVKHKIDEGSGGSAFNTPDGDDPP